MGIQRHHVTILINYTIKDFGHSQFSELKMEIKPRDIRLKLIHTLVELSRPLKKTTTPALAIYMYIVTQYR